MLKTLCFLAAVVRMVFILTVLAGSLITDALASGVLHTSHQIESPVMNSPVSYSIYLPAGHNSSTVDYPVVYLLHGGDGDETSWADKGQVEERLNRAIERGQLPPLILVMPDGGMTWFVDSADGTVPWERMLVDELIPHIESTYRASGDVYRRGIAGLSMGGFGALSISMRRPELFSSAAAISASLGTDERMLGYDQATYDRFYAPAFGPPGLAGEQRLTAHWIETAPHKVILTADPEIISQSRYWLDCGDDDDLLMDNSRFHTLLKERGVEHEFRVRDGGHNWRYWRTGLVPALEFISQGFPND